MKRLLLKKSRIEASSYAPIKEKYGTFTYDLDIAFSVIVDVSPSGVDERPESWEFDPVPNDVYGDAYIDEETRAKIINIDDIAQYIMDELNDNDEVSSQIGKTIKVNGIAFFSVDIDDVDTVYDYQGLDEDDDPYYDMSFDAESSEANVKEYNITVINTVLV